MLAKALFNADALGYAAPPTSKPRNNLMKKLSILFAVMFGSMAFAQDKGNQSESPLQSVRTPDGTCQPIPDNLYRGDAFAAGQAVCKTFSTGAGTINNLRLNLGLTHTWVGDLVVKVRNPAGTKTATLVSRAGAAETDDTGLLGPAGDSSNLLNSSVLSFADGLTPSAELLGAAPLGTNDVVCRDLGSACSYGTNAGATVPALGLSTFNGDTAGAGWTICVGDRAALDTGEFCSVTVGAAPAGIAISPVTPAGNVTLPGYAAGATPGTSSLALNFNSTGGNGSIGCVATGTGYSATPNPLALVAGTPGTVTARFTGTAAGTFTGTLTCTSAAPATGGPFVYNLSTTVTGAAITVTPVTAPGNITLPSFVAGAAGSSSSLLSFNVTGGNGSVACSATGAGFSATPNPLALVAGTPGVVTVSYAGTTAGTFTGSLSCVAAPAGGTFVYPLSVTVGAPVALVTQVPSLNMLGLLALIAGIIGVGFMVSRRQG
jgi:subtilisin-like proprotein convertase family protein